MRRRPYLDIQTVQSRGFSERGIPRYTTELAIALLRAGAPVAALALNPHHPFPHRLPPELAGAPELRWNTAAALHEALQDGPVLYHMLSPFERPDLLASALPSHVLGTDIPIVCTVYDLIPDIAGLLRPGTRPERFHRIRNRLLVDADLLLALSEQTRRDVIERLDVDGDRVAVVGAAASGFFRSPAPGERPKGLLERHLPQITRQFLLTVSAWEARKNTELLIHGFAQLPRELRTSLQLVVTCTLPPEGLTRWQEHAAGAGLADDEVVFTGFVTDPVLRALYQETVLFVYPSRYEGFGLPVLEAALCGAPAITTSTSSLPEVLDWPPATFDPDDATALAALIERSLHDDSFRSRLQEVGAAAASRHTWDRVVRRTLAAYERVDPPVRRRRRTQPLRVALVGPFPPVRSGVARYNLEVANRLAARCELDCFVDACDWVHVDISHELPARVQSVGPRRPLGSRARWFPARAFGRLVDPARYDAVLYAIGNSWFHHDTLALARRYPGVAWFHDVDLVGLYITYAHRLLGHDAPAAAALFREVLARYGVRAPDLPVTLADRRWATYGPYRGSGLRFALELACDSRMSIVASHLARQLLEFDAGPLAPLAPVDVLPLAVPNWPSRPRPRTADPPVVVTLGRQGDAKQPDTVIDAMAIVHRSRRAQLAIVGEIRPDLRARLEHRAAAHGLGSAIEVTGFVSDRDYRDRIDRASCAVQLRAHSKGEGSAAVGDALAAGLPVITNIPSCLELRDGTLQRVPAGAGPDTIAGEIERLLDDPVHRERLREGGLEYARSWSFDSLASRLVDRIRNLPRRACVPERATA